MKLLGRTVTLAAVACSIGACSAAPGEPASSSVTSESISCTSDGLHVDSCGGTVGAGARVCGTSATCSATIVPGFPSPNGGGGLCDIDYAFSDELAAIGCTTTSLYVPAPAAYGFYVAWCPSVPVVTTPVGAIAPNWRVISECNNCTGSPPSDGWVLVAWAPYQGGHGPTDRCPLGTLPGGSCASGTSCLTL